MIFSSVQNQIFLEQLKEFRDVELFYNVAFLAKLIKRQADMTDD